MSSSQIPAAPPPRLKLVIRRLPPTLPEELLWKSLAPWISDQSCLWKRYVKGRPGDAYGSHPVHSRAYCLMSSVEALIALSQGFDGHIFRSKTGVEYQAIVEFAPLQKTPYKAKVKADGRQNTIDEDPDYLSFLESLKAAPTKLEPKESVPVAQPTTTPLLDHLRAHGTKSKKKQKAESSPSDVARSAATASVNAAAARRAPNTASATAPTMIAGKGRDVSVVPAAGGAPPAGAGKKKGKGKTKGQPSVPAPAGNASIPTSTARPQILERPIPSHESSEAASRGRGGGGGKGRGRGRGGGPGADGGVPPTDGAGRGRGGGAAGGGGGGGRTKTARGAVMEILTRNADGDRGRGRGRGGSVGRGGGATAPAASLPPPSEARIDM